MTNDKWQTAEEGKTLLLKIGMVGWLYCFVKNPDPADHKAISNPESALLDPQSKELFQGDPPPTPPPWKAAFLSLMA